MNSLVSRNSLLDDFFRDFTPGYLRQAPARRQPAGPDQGGRERG